LSKKSQGVRLTDEQRFDWLRLIRSENVGPRTFRALINNCGGARAALEALPELARRGGAKKPIRVAKADEIERERALASKNGVRFIALGEPEYPPALRQIDSAPPILAVRGRDEALQQPAVAIVGSRNASAAGLTFADRLARGLGQAGYIVVSGLARGIDLRSHVAALETGTVGVLAGGHTKPYPPEAAALLPRIAEYGAIVSEMPLEWEPRGRDFPRRNRIVSGLSLGTVVIEAARGSGSLITAKFAAEQNREVFAAPGSPLDPRAEGTNDLLRDGANICARLEDVLAVLEPLRARDPFAIFEEDPRDIGEPLWGEHSLFGVDPEATPRARLGDAFDEPAGRDFESRLGGDADHRRVEALLSPSPISIDDLARAAELDVKVVRQTIVELDLAGRIEYCGGERVALIGPAGGID
jgi:DNA processing protein